MLTEAEKKEKRASASKKYQQENREKQNEYRRLYYKRRVVEDPEYTKRLAVIRRRANAKFRKNNPERVRAYNRAWAKANPPSSEKTRINTLKYGYGITIEDYGRRLTEQGGKCAVCGGINPGNKNKKHLCVDHDHVTGRVRGLLCSRCNLGLGFFDDSIESLNSAIKYLQASKECIDRGDV